MKRSFRNSQFQASFLGAFSLNLLICSTLMVKEYYAHHLLYEDIEVSYLPCELKLVIAAFYFPMPDYLTGTTL